MCQVSAKVTQELANS